MPDDLFGKRGLDDGMEPMTKERAMKIFQDFFRFGDEMDPEAPERAKGIKRAAGGVVYAPMKGLLYGGKTVLGGVIMGTAAVVAGTGAMVANVALGVKEMGEAGVQAARKRSGSKASSESSGNETTPSTVDEASIEKPGPTFMSGLKKATVGAVAAPVAVRWLTAAWILFQPLTVATQQQQGIVTGGGVLLASGVAAGGYLVGGFAGAASNVASGVAEVKAANKLEKERQRASLGSNRSSIENGGAASSAPSEAKGFAEPASVPAAQTA